MKWTFFGLKPSVLPFGPVPTEATIDGYDVIVRFELSAEFTRWKQRLVGRNVASTGMKPEESLASHGLSVAAN